MLEKQKKMTKSIMNDQQICSLYFLKIFPHCYFLSSKFENFQFQMFNLSCCGTQSHHYKSRGSIDQFITGLLPHDWLRHMWTGFKIEISSSLVISVLLWIGMHIFAYLFSHVMFSTISTNIYDCNCIWTGWLFSPITICLLE